MSLLLSLMSSRNENVDKQLSLILEEYPLENKPKYPADIIHTINTIGTYPFTLSQK